MQGDHDTIEITATIYDGNEKYVIDCDMIEIDCKSPNNTKNSIKVKSNTEHTVTFLLDQTILSENGKHEFSIRFMSDPDISLTTFPAIIFVSQAPIGEFTPGEFATMTELVLESKKCLNETKKSYEKLITEKGKPGGIASLDEEGKLPLSQLPGVNETWNQSTPSDSSQRVNDYWVQEF